MNDSPISCLAIAGPTACGKTSVALAAAQTLQKFGLGCEIISVDSALVYRGMDIGTAKPTAEEIKIAPHHLIDLIEPSDHYSAADFVRDTHKIAAEIHARGNIALLVGGTMMYFNALFHGLDDLPGQDDTIRAALNERARREGWPVLHAELAAIDPATASRLAPNDSQRIQRALEVWQLTGRPLSSFHHRSAAQGTEKGANDLSGVYVRDGLACTLLTLMPDDRAWLHERIAQRLDAMLAAGFVREVEKLKNRADLHENLPSMRCVGYRQIWQILEEDDDPPLSKIRNSVLPPTRQLAKRQITWLRSLPAYKTIACDAENAQAEAVNVILKIIQNWKN